jgi:hypothetical protein
VDGVTPDCETETGCPIPELTAGNMRILQIRGLLVRLNQIVGPETICRILGVDEEDLSLLALIEGELGAKADPHQEN